VFLPVKWTFRELSSTLGVVLIQLFASLLERRRREDEAEAEASSTRWTNRRLGIPARTRLWCICLPQRATKKSFTTSSSSWLVLGPRSNNDNDVAGRKEGRTGSGGAAGIAAEKNLPVAEIPFPPRLLVPVERKRKERSPSIKQ